MPRLIKKRVTEEVYEVDEELNDVANEDEEVDEDDGDEGAVVEARSTAKVTKRRR